MLLPPNIFDLPGFYEITSSGYHDSYQRQVKTELHPLTNTSTALGHQLCDFVLKRTSSNYFFHSFQSKRLGIGNT